MWCDAVLGLNYGLQRHKAASAGFCTQRALYCTTRQGIREFYNDQQENLHHLLFDVSHRRSLLTRCAS